MSAGVALLIVQGIFCIIMYFMARDIYVNKEAIKKMIKKWNEFKENIDEEIKTSLKKALDEEINSLKEKNVN